MSEKGWCKLVFVIYIFLLTVIGGTVFIVDPFFHYHAPIEGMSYTMEKSEYINDGITKHMEYNAMITGTSMTSGFKTEEAEKYFGEKFIRITYPGEGLKKINDNLKTAIAVNPELELVIRGIDPIWFVTDENWLGYDKYPEYLYDKNVWNDVNYLYNGNIFVDDVMPELIRTLKKEPAKRLDDFVKGDNNKAGKEKVLNGYERPDRTEKIIEQSETDEFFSLMNRNIEKNVISTIKDNPNITFYIFIPPYSICWWDSVHQYGDDVLKRRIAMEKATIEKLLEYENVHLFSFSNNFQLICNLNNYTDEIHYIKEVSSQMLLWMKEGKYELTQQNYEEYIADITKFYCEYDYDIIFK